MSETKSFGAKTVMDWGQKAMVACDEEEFQQLPKLVHHPLTVLRLWSCRRSIRWGGGFINSWSLQPLQVVVHRKVCQGCCHERGRVTTWIKRFMMIYDDRVTAKTYEAQLMTAWGWPGSTAVIGGNARNILHRYFSTDMSVIDKNKLQHFSLH